MAKTTEKAPEMSPAERDARGLDPRAMKWALRRLAFLKDVDRAALLHLADRKLLTAHLVEFGRSAAQHDLRLERANTKREDAEKEVTAQWISPGDEVPDPLPDAYLGQYRKALDAWEKTEGRAFAKVAQAGAGGG